MDQKPGAGQYDGLSANDKKFALQFNAILIYPWEFEEIGEPASVSRLTKHSKTASPIKVKWLAIENTEKVIEVS